MGKDAVLIGYRHKIGCNADDKKVKQRNKRLERDIVFLRICLDELESHAAARKIIKWIMAVLPLRVEHGHGTRKFRLRKMMVTYDHLDSLRLGVIHLFYRLDAAVKSDYELESVL